MDLEKKKRLEVAFYRYLQEIDVHRVNLNDITSDEPFPPVPKAPAKNCYTCVSLSVTGFCQVHAASPPPDFMEQGCDQWDLDIPF